MPYKLRVSVPRTDAQKVVGMAYTHNETEFKGHAPQTIILLNGTVYSDPKDPKTVTIEYDWREIRTLAGSVSELKLTRPVDFNAFPGVT
jgi:hypothetical protein